jgi:hypothetical protein
MLDVTYKLSDSGFELCRVLWCSCIGTHKTLRSIALNDVGVFHLEAASSEEQRQEQNSIALRSAARTRNGDENVMAS